MSLRHWKICINLKKKKKSQANLSVYEKKTKLWIIHFSGTLNKNLYSIVQISPHQWASGG